MSKQKWETLTHMGPVFQPKYKRLPTSIKLRYNQRPVSKLSPEAEEAIRMYANLKRDKKNDKYTKNGTFNENFFKDLRNLLTRQQRSLIVDFRRLDFSRIMKYLQKENLKPKILNSKIKKEKEILKNKHGHCIVNGRKQSLGGYTVEPSGIFIARDETQFHGRIKLRIKPEDVTINCSANARVKPPPGTHWKEIVNDQKAVWTAKYTNSLGQLKYIQQGNSSIFKETSDRLKYELARDLGKNIKRIRNIYMKDINSRDEYDKQLGIVMYFIDQLALRIGNEKGAGEADTVGCCTLRKEHIKLNGRNVVSFNFKGKDSIVFQKEFKLPNNVYNVLKTIHNRKKKKDNLFNLLNAGRVNTHLRELHPGLSAKVFRTFHASSLFQDTLQKHVTALNKRNKKQTELLKIFNKANLKAAKLCNHKKACNEKVYNKIIQRFEERIEKKENEITDLNNRMVALTIRQKRADLKVRIEKKKEQLEALVMNYELKVHGKDFALNTSKQNYIDPRIAVGWCRAHKLPLEKVFSKALLAKYQWAVSEVKRDFKF